MKRYNVAFELPFAEIKTWVWAEHERGARDMAEKMLAYEYGIDRTHFEDVPWDVEERVDTGVSDSGLALA